MDKRTIKTEIFNNCKFVTGTEHVITDDELESVFVTCDRKISVENTTFRSCGFLDCIICGGVKFENVCTFENCTFLGECEFINKNMMDFVNCKFN